MLFFTLIQTITSALPGTLQVSLVNPQASYCTGSTATFKVTIDSVPFTTEGGVTFIDAEIRGTKPGGPRGFIAQAMPRANLQEFITAGGTHTFTFPADYAGYSYFFRPAVYSAAEEGQSSNFFNSAGTTQFQVIDCSGTTVIGSTSAPTATIATTTAIATVNPIITSLMPKTTAAPSPSPTGPTSDAAKLTTTLLSLIYLIL